MTTVTWVQDGFGSYEISSSEHLKQLMNEGTLYTDAGSSPVSYWGSTTKYIQTADIDLLGNSADIKPIGNDVTQFESEYDGGNYSISNWSYLDPNFSSTTPCESHTGVFGYTLNTVLKNIVLSGVFSLHGFQTHGGLLVGRAIVTDIFNIVCDFETGTNIKYGSVGPITNVPILHYKFDKADLTIDSGSSGLDLTNSAVVSVTDAERGLVASFNGFSSLKLASGSVPTSLLGFNPRSYTFWLNHQHPATRGFFLSNGSNPSATRIRLRIENGILGADISDAAKITSPNISGSTWQHITATYDGTTLKTYINGVQDLTWVVSTNVGVGEFVIGAESEDMENHFIGLLSDVRVYDIALSASEINTVMMGNIYSGCIGIQQGMLPSNRSTLTGFQIKGDIDFDINGEINPSCIGVCAGGLSNTDASLIESVPTVSGIDGTNCGGIVGILKDSGISDCMNGMTGDVTGYSSAGGIVGDVLNTHSVSNTINSMTGNITSTTGSSGGILGESGLGGTYDSLFNYMGGNVSGVNAGGMIGTALSTTTVTNLINAMNGTVDESVVGTGTLTSNVTVNTDFGLTYTSNTYGTATPLTGFLTLSGFPLPYFTISGTDSLGNSYDFNIVFANIGGNVNYSNTHLIISGGSGAFQDGSTILPIVFNAISRVSNIVFTIGAIPGAIAYRLTSQGTGFSEIIAKDNFTVLTQTILNLEPETEYTFRLYSTTDGSVYTLSDTIVETTLANVGTNYEKNDYLDGGKFDLSSLDQSSFELISDIMNDVFTTGDIMKVKTTGNPVVSKFVNRGDTLDITGTDAVVAPFSTTGGSTQEFSLTLSNASTITVSYDETNEEVTIDSTVYNTGDSFILDSKKVTIVDI